MNTIDNLYVNARRAKDEKDYETAVKYYEMILQEEPTSWEASFFSIYLRAVKTELSEIAEAVVDVLNSLNQVLSLIKNHLSNRDEQINAVREVSSCCGNIATLTFTFYHAALLQSEINRLMNVVNDVPNRNSDQNDVKEHLLDCCNIAWVLVYSIGDKIEEEFGDYTELHVVSADSWKMGVGFQIELVEYSANKEKQLENLAVTVLKIRKYDPSYTLPKTEKQKAEQSTVGCYIATCVYGSYDCPQVWTLRRFRDYTLATTWYGRLFIQCYYVISPKLVHMFGKSAWFKKIWKKRLDSMVLSLRTKGVKDTPYSDKKRLLNSVKQ